MATIGIVPARMGSSRFPGKPLAKILDRTMLEHCYQRARLSGSLDIVVVATPDREIYDFCFERDFDCVLTPGTGHRRALDACADAVEGTDGDNIVLCIQGDEPMVSPDNIDAMASPFLYESCHVRCLALPFKDKDDPNTVKIVTDSNGYILYTSRCNLPAARSRIAGLLGWRASALAIFAAMESNDHEMKESCDLNRWLGWGRSARIQTAVTDAYQSVDCPEDIKTVEKLMPDDPWWGKY